MKSIKNFLINKAMSVLLMFLMATGCTNSSNTFNYNADSTPIVNWSRIDSIDINEINSDLLKGKPITNTQKLANKSLLIWVLFFQPNRG